MRAGIIGLNWGRVHVGTLKKAGVEVAVVCANDVDRAKRVAAEDGIPLGTADLGALDALDIIVIASPGPTHASMLRRFQGKYLICEKPLFAEPTPKTFVNYAFSFVESVRAATAFVARSTVARCDVDVRVRLDAPFTAAQWVREVALHPLSWVAHALGPIETMTDTLVAPGTVEAVLGAAKTPIFFRLTTDGPPGIHYGIRLKADAGLLSFEGTYAPGHPWRFSPVRLNDSEVAPGSSGEHEPWFAANDACVAAMVACFRGECAWEDGLRKGLYDASRAARLEAVIAPLFS
ncbi:MAG: Gfo/Idh/MocA family oxidoreductase [Myxococcota bacterium]